MHWCSDRGISAADVRPARPLCSSVPPEGTRRLPGREEQATAQGFAPAFANPTRLARKAGLRVRSRRHLQPVRGGRTKRRAADSHGHRPSRQDRFRGFRTALARAGLCHGAAHPSGDGQSQHPLPQMLRGSARRQESKGKH